MLYKNPKFQTCLHDSFKIKLKNGKILFKDPSTMELFRYFETCYAIQ